jgi:hypothetical protein
MTRLEDYAEKHRGLPVPTKERKQQERWKKMMRRGHLSFVVLNIFIWAGSYVLVRLLHVLCFRWGWLQSPGSTSVEDFFLVAVLARGHRR